MALPLTRTAAVAAERSLMFMIKSGNEGVVLFVSSGRLCSPPMHIPSPK